VRAAKKREEREKQRLLK
jgi:hypothetical protein